MTRAVLLHPPGPVSLLLARRCRMCIGIEATPSSVRDANENARINRIQNVEFINGRVEQVRVAAVRYPDVLWAGCSVHFFYCGVSLMFCFELGPQFLFIYFIFLFPLVCVFPVLGFRAAGRRRLNFVFCWQTKGNFKYKLQTF